MTPHLFGKAKSSVGETEPTSQGCLSVQDAILSGDSGALDSTKYKKLDELLNQTDMYTQFLMEQMKEGDSKEEAAPEVEAEDGKVGSKRKAGKGAGKNAKRQKPTAATQVCHMECT